MQPTAVIHALERTKEKEEEVNAYLNPLPPPGLELFEVGQHFKAADPC